MKFRRHQVARLIFVPILVTVMCSLLRADTWSTPATELALKIAGKIGSGSSVVLSIQNASSLSSAEVASASAQIESQLRNQRIQLVSGAQSAIAVNVTLSENAQNYLWIAQIQQGNASNLVMLRVPRQHLADPHNPAITLNSKLIVTHDEPILDVAVYPDKAAVLTPFHVLWYHVQGTNWQESQSLPISHSRTFPRDVRGRIWTSTSNTLDVSLPGLRCTQATVQETALSCTESDDPWPLSSSVANIGVEAFYSPVRNFFNGTVTFQNQTPGQQQQNSVNLAPFYSVAVVVEEGLPLWAFAGVDGHVTFLGGRRQANPVVRAIPDWGSDIASIANPCEQGGRLVLATRPADNTQTDAVQAFDVVGRNATRIAAPVEFPGPVTALWSQGTDDHSVTASVHNLRTGKYEAYNLSLDCNR